MSKKRNHEANSSDVQRPGSLSKNDSQSVNLSANVTTAKVDNGGAKERNFSSDSEHSSLLASPGRRKHTDAKTR